MNTDLSIVGKRMHAYGAINKVTGAAKYPVDAHIPGMLVGKVLHSPHAHALIRRIDKSRAEALPGVFAVLTWEDVPKQKLNPSVQDWQLHDTSLEVNDMYILSEKARFVGDMVGAVAAIDVQTADKALSLIDIEYEVLPALFDVGEAMKAGAPQVHDFTENNISRSFRFPGERGDVDKEFSESEAVVTATFKTSRQYLNPLELLSCLAEFSPNGDLTIRTPVQRPLVYRKKVAQLFKLPESRVNVICEYAGGFFGEANWPIVPITVALAKKAGKPVKLEFSRLETAINTASREAYVLSGTLGATKDGILTALKEDVIVESGAYFSRSAHCTTVHMSVLTGMYRLPAVSAEAKAVYSNIPMASGVRGYGGPAAFFLLEQLMDMAAEKLNMDPLEFRLKNVKRMGDFGHAFPVETAPHEKVIRLGAEKIGWAEKRARAKGNGPIRRGIGMSGYFDVSGGQPFEHSERHLEMQLNEDGLITIILNKPDGGMNLLGTVAQIAAEVLCVRYEDIRFVHGSTEGKMWDCGMGANSGLYGVGNAVVNAAGALKRRILEEAARQLDVKVDKLDINDRNIQIKGKKEPTLSLQRLANDAIWKGSEANRSLAVLEHFSPTANPNPFGAVFTDVAVDTETGEVKIEKLVLSHDIGRAINPMTVEGQLEGGISMGVGYAMFEDAAIDPTTGVNRGDNFNNYKIPSTLDMPEMEVLLYEEPAPSGPFGGKGVGMCGVMGIAPAVANAVYDAVGVRVHEMPLTPERLLAALKMKSAK